MTLFAARSAAARTVAARSAAVRSVAVRSAAGMLAVTAGIGLTGCGSAAPELSVDGAYVPQPVTESMAGGFLTVRNDGDEEDKLTAVSSDLAGKVEIHRTVGRTMQRTESLTVPAHGELELGRGGNHLMLLDLQRKPVEGEKVSVTLRFEKSDPVKVSVPVEAANYVPDKGTSK